MNQNRKNIIIGRTGLTVKLHNYKLGIKSATDVDMILYSVLSQLNPEYHFYFVGPSELDKLTKDEYLSIFPNSNVHSAWTRDIFKSNNYQKMIDYFDDNNIKIDFALISAGSSGKFTIPNFVPRFDGLPRKPLRTQRMYMAPYVYSLNHLNCPVYVIADDVRNILLNFSDLYNRERLVFTQTNCTLQTINHIQSETDWTFTKDNIKCIYSGIEKLDLIGMNPDFKKFINIDNKLKSPKSEHIIVISHGHGTSKINSNKTIKDGRLSGYKEYIIDGLANTIYKDTKIYGIWSDDVYLKYPNIQNKPLAELNDIKDNARYSLIYSQAPNFVTCKPWEIIANGLIPFIHPEYDPDRLLQLPNYCYVDSPVDFLNKVQTLDNDDNLYLDILNQCLNCITENDMNGLNINNFILTNIAKDLNFEYEPLIESNFRLNLFGSNNMNCVKNV